MTTGDVFVFVADVNGEGIVGGVVFDFGDFFGLTVSSDLEMEMVGVLHGEVAVGLIGIGDDTGEAVILLGVWEDGVVSFDDFHFGHAGGIFGKVVVEGGFFEVKIVGGGEGGSDVEKGDE